MKTTLTSSDPVGWYECTNVHTDCRCFRQFDGVDLEDGKGGLELVSDYTSFVHLVPETEAISRHAYDSVVEELDYYKQQLSRLKSKPYPMRRADKPDCVGLWANREGSVLEIYNEKTSPTHGPPFYYLGPIPVIPKEKPKVRQFTMRVKATGEEIEVIRYGVSWLEVRDDGSALKSYAVAELEAI